MLLDETVQLFLHNRKHRENASEATINTYRYALKHFTEFMHNRDKDHYEDITRIDMMEFTEFIRLELDKGRWSKSRFVLVVKVLKVMFRWVEQDEDCKEERLRGWADRLPKAGRAPRRDYIPSQDDLKKWNRAFSGRKGFLAFRDAMIFATLLDTGIRRGELVLLEEGHVKCDQCLIYVPDGKTGSRIVTISKQLSERLKAYLKKKERSRLAGSKFLFPSARNKDLPQHPNFITKVFLRVKKELDLPKISPHTLRHAFSTYFLVNGGEVETLRMQTGHKTYEAMMNYTHLAKVNGLQAQKMMNTASPLAMLSRRAS